MLCQRHDAGPFEQHMDIGQIIKFTAVIRLSTAEVEHSFSLMNLIRTPLRKRLLPENLAHCMQLRKHGKRTDDEYHEILQKWLGVGNTKSKKWCIASRLSVI